jgi:hypothetical protein
MYRPLFSSSLASLCLLLAAGTAATAASLTRIETRPYYGATVTEEEGVRVFRPLPLTRHIIINPDGRTPLNLTIEDRNVVVHQHNYVAPFEDTADGAGRYGGGYGLGLPRVHRGDRGHRHGRRSRPGGYMIRVPSRK